MRNELAYVDVLYAGSEEASVTIDDESPGTLTLRHSKIAYGGGVGLMSVNITYASQGGNLHKMENMIFLQNNEAPVQIPPAQISKLDPSSSYNNNNGDNHIIIHATNQNGSCNWINESEKKLWPLLEDGTTYFVKGEIKVGTGLEIEKGTVIEFDTESRLNIEKKGYLKAVGTQESPIVFTGAVTSSP